MIEIRMVGTPEHLTEGAHVALSILDKQCFPADPLYPKKNCWWWIVKGEGLLAGFAGLKYTHAYGGTRWGFLCRAGVLPDFRGLGIQKKLIRAREKRARIEGLTHLYTYVMIENPASANSLISCGYKLYEPVDLFGGNSLYFQKEL